jgi:predicted DNA-binding protein (MmcQ/YjbR family)
MPEAYEDFPWGDRVFKVKKKVFFFLGHSDAEGLGLGAKLPHSSQAALMLPFVEPTAYGLGMSGWVTAQFTAKDSPPLPMLEDWVRESYRAIAPVKLAALLEGDAPKSNKVPGKNVKPTAKYSVPEVGDQVCLTRILGVIGCASSGRRRSWEPARRRFRFA